MNGGARSDLGALDGPVLVFGGPYGNLEATEALLADAQRLGIPASRMICTGDVAAYCAEPQACSDLLRQHAIATVMGNCEESLAADAEDCGCGFSEGSACELLSVAWFAYCRAALDRDAKAWMGSLPRRVSFTLAGRRFTAIHGGGAQINRFIFASTPAREKQAELAALDAEAIVAGHCGIPFTELVPGRDGAPLLWHNAGAIGMPANDGTARVWYSLLIPEGDGIRISLRPLVYDHAKAARKMRARGLPEAYAASLVSGLWPSCDVLPPAELAARGSALAPDSLSWSAGPRSNQAENQRLGQGRRAS